MNIRLPKRYFYRDRGQNGYAYVSHNKLFIKGYVNFEDLMYNLTYTLDGYRYCLYCNNELNNKTRTLDHMYPRAWGGISIPNNLIPCCKACNQKKKDMTESQFEVWNSKITPNQKDAFYQACINENAWLMDNGIFVVDDNWVSKYNVTKILKYFSFKGLKESRIKEIEEYFNLHKQYPELLIVSGNNWVFRGKYILEHAKRHKITFVTAVVLSNVIVIKDSP